MNREIKFRAWDERSKSFVINVKDLGRAHYYNQPLSQYTGLKDKNGKEIYEGDIVKIPNLWYGKEDCVEENKDKEFFYYEIKSEMCWNHEGYGWNFPGKEYEMEVIGNIYENPELMITKEEKRGNGIESNGTKGNNTKTLK